MRIGIILHIKSYFLAGKLLHFITLIELLAIIIIIPDLMALNPNSLAGIALNYFALLYLFSLPVFSQLDARSRFQNYKQIKDQLYIYGFDKRILNQVLKSRCQRDAAFTSASELGLDKECKNYFRKCGYKWYHLTPDFLFRNPQFLLSKYFWKTTFFTPTYKSKFNFLEHKPKFLSPNANFKINANPNAC